MTSSGITDPHQMCCMTGRFDAVRSRFALITRTDTVVGCGGPDVVG